MCRANGTDERTAKVSSACFLSSPLFKSLVKLYTVIRVKPHHPCSLTPSAGHRLSIVSSTNAASPIALSTKYCFARFGLSGSIDSNRFRAHKSAAAKESRTFALLPFDHPSRVLISRRGGDFSLLQITRNSDTGYRSGTRPIQSKDFLVAALAAGIEASDPVARNDFLSILNAKQRAQLATFANGPNFNVGRHIPLQ